MALNVDTGKPVWHFQYTPNDSWDYDEVGVHMLYDATINGEQRKIVGHFARNGFYYTLDRTNGKFIKADQYVNDLNWTKGINPKTGRPLDYDPKVDVQIYNPVARALRGDGKKRACPTWHGGVAHQPTAYHPVKKIAYGVGIEGCFTQNGAAVVFKSKDGDVDVKASEKREYSSDLYYGSITAYDTVKSVRMDTGRANQRFYHLATVRWTEGGFLVVRKDDGSDEIIVAGGVRAAGSGRR